MEAFDGQASCITGVSIALTTTATCIVCMRMAAVYKRRGWLGLEEAMVALSNCCLIIITVIACEAVKYGFGLRAKAIPAAGGDLHLALKASLRTRRPALRPLTVSQNFFLFQIFYKCVICFNKLAFLLLYLRVFQFHSFRVICLCSIGVVVAGSFSFIAATLFECIPIAYNWNRQLPGHCINNSAFRWSWAAFNTATDVWVSVLPIPFIQRLQMTRTKKIGLIILFALGLFVCVTSAIRMKALVASTRAAKDTTWDSAPAFLWSYIEAAVGLVCTCLPSLRWLLSRALPMLSSSSDPSKRNYYGTHSAGRAYKMSRLSSSATNTQPQQPHPRLVPDKGRSRIDTTAVTTNQFGESGSEEHIIGPAQGRAGMGEIQVRTCVSVYSVTAMSFV
ncbi:putative integral membrane protein [Neofusicoccum parvum UCRNP2]|uniref:Putative integral membrane protein n=1 Tax=Botryosphaeria parva (strain UCR-NP2) TaxID=1287680 RepID=R1EXX1_BOTPV|nr:putative integral membrane protein [Neofusicoccum parvum UCRNP2]